MVLGKVDEVVLDQRPAFHQQHRIERSHGRLTKYMMRASGSFKCKGRRGNPSKAKGEKIAVKWSRRRYCHVSRNVRRSGKVGEGWGEGTIVQAL
jgi:hypothetical protein